MAAARLYQRKWVLIKLPIALLALAAMAWLWQNWLPLPPDEVTFSTGRPEGVYHAYAQRYAAYFAEHGVRVTVAPSDGSIDNLDRLRGRAGGPASQLAFVQGGIGFAQGNPPGGGPRLATIARVDLEPLWIFARPAGLDSLAQFQGLRVSLGPRGSGTRQLAVALLAQARLSTKDVVDSDLAGPALVQALRQGQLDAAMMVSAPGSPIIRQLLETPGVHLVQLSRSSALIERMPYLQARLLPQGSINPSLKLPPRDTTMLVTTASLVAREDLHPALQRLAAAAAQEIHSGAGTFHRTGEFPNLKRVEFPASQPARRTLAQGLPWFERELPFWTGQWLVRIAVVCLPVALLAFWLARLVPGYLRWLVESRLARWYGELKYIEWELAREGVSGLDARKHLNRLNEIERSMTAFVTPDYLMPRWFTLRHHIDFVRMRLFRQRGR